MTQHWRYGNLSAPVSGRRRWKRDTWVDFGLSVSSRTFPNTSISWRRNKILFQRCERTRLLFGEGFSGRQEMYNTYCWHDAALLFSGCYSPSLIPSFRPQNLSRASTCWTFLLFFFQDSSSLVFSPHSLTLPQASAAANRIMAAMLCTLKTHLVCACVCVWFVLQGSHRRVKLWLPSQSRKSQTLNFHIEAPWTHLKMTQKMLGFLLR